MEQTETDVMDPNTIWAEEIQSHFLIGRMSDHLPFTRWYRYITEHRIMDENAAMDRILKCASIWNTTKWVIHSESLRRHFLKVQKTLFESSLPVSTVQEFVGEIRSSLYYSPEQLEMAISTTTNEDSSRMHSDFLKYQQITFVKEVSEKVYIDTYKRHYIFESNKVAMRRPTMIARGNRTYVMPKADMSYVLAYCFFVTGVDLMNVCGEESIPFQIWWMASLLGISPEQFITLPSISEDDIELTKGYIVHIYEPLSCFRFSRFFDGMNLCAEQSALKSLFMPSKEPLEIIQRRFQTLCSREILVDRARILFALNNCSNGEIKSLMNTTEFCSLGSWSTTELGSSENGNCDKLSTDNLEHYCDPCITQNPLEELRIDRCFPGDGISTGNYQSRFFSVLLWTVALFSDSMVNLRFVTSMDVFKLCASIMSILLGGINQQRKGKETLWIFLCIREILSDRVPSHQEETSLTIPKQRDIDRALQDVFYYTLLVGSYFCSQNDFGQCALKQLFGKYIPLLSSSHMCAITISQQLKWPPYQKYHELMSFMVPWNSSVTSWDINVGWNVIPKCTLRSFNTPELLSTMERTYGLFLTQSLVDTIHAASQDEEEWNTSIILPPPLAGYAHLIPLLDSVHHMVKNILYFHRVYQWWKPPQTEETQHVSPIPSFLIRPSKSYKGMTSEEECPENPTEEEEEGGGGGEERMDIGLEILEEECADSTDESFVNLIDSECAPPWRLNLTTTNSKEEERDAIEHLLSGIPSIFTQDGFSIDPHDPVIIPKATFFVLPIPIEDNSSGLLFRWSVNRDKLKEAPIFSDNESEMDSQQRTTKYFVNEYTMRFANIVRLGSYVMHQSNEAITKLKFRGNSKHLITPCYPVLSCIMQQTYETLCRTRTQVTSKNFAESTNLVRQTLGALTSSEAFLAMRAIEVKSFAHEIFKREGESMEHLSRMFTRPAQYRDSIHAVFFVLSIPTLWELIQAGYIAQGDFSGGVAKLHTFFRLFSSCEESATVHLNHEHSEEESAEDAHISTSMTRAVKIRGRMGPGGSLEDLCPTFLELLSSNDHFNLSSCSYDISMSGNKWKKKSDNDLTEEEEEEEVFEQEKSDSVEYQGDAPAKWFFFSRHGWTHFLVHCIEHLWNGESLVSLEHKRENPSTFDLIVLDLFMHGYTSEEFRKSRRKYRGRVKNPMKTKLNPYIDVPWMASPVTRETKKVKGNAGVTEEERETWLRMQRVLSCGLRKCGYNMSQPTNESQNEKGWNAFGCVVLLLEQGFYLKGIGEREYSFLLMDYLTHPVPESKSVDHLLANAPVNLSVQVKRRGTTVYKPEHDVIHTFHVTRYGDAIFLPEILPGIGSQYFGGRAVSSYVCDMLYLFGRSPTGFL